MMMMKGTSEQPSAPAHMATPAAPITALTLARAAADLQKVTTELIRALTEQLRDPSEARAQQVHALETRRDQLHERLTQLEDQFLAQKR